MVVACLALFVALTGTSVAAVQLARNSVKSRHIANGQVKRPDIAAGAVNSSKVANGALGSQDFAPGTLTTGPQGPAGVVGNVTVQRLDRDLQDGASIGIDVPCPAGTKAIGGGASTAATGNDVALLFSRPGSQAFNPISGQSFQGWYARYQNYGDGDNPGTIVVSGYAVCAQTP
jgi:hypothetical protein